MKAIPRLYSSLICLCLTASAQSVVAVRGQTASQLQKVQNIEELRSRDSIQRARAAEFPFQGDPLIDVKTISVVAEPEEHGVIVRGAAPPTQDELLAELVCSSPVVMLGTVLTAKAYLNLKETFLYSDHTVLVARWIRSSSRQTQITLSAAGGRVQVGQVLLDTSWGPRYEIGGRYVLFLREIPRGNAYREVHYPLLAAKGFVVSSTQTLVQGLKKTEAALVDQLSELTKNCKGRL